jgi:hypothetical protein
MSALLDLTGSYTLRPGVVHSIEGWRPIMGPGLLGRLLSGQSGEAIERLLGQLFTLCSHAHRRTARLAVQAAQVQDEKFQTQQPGIFLCLETARDHLRSMALDWPRHQRALAASSTQLDWLRGCPLPMNHTPLSGSEDEAWETLAQVRHWLEDKVLGQAIGESLLRHEQAETLHQWCQTHANHWPPAQALHTWSALAHDLTPDTRSLDLLDTDLARQTANLRAVAQEISSNPGFAQHPTWLGQCAETGPWTRLRHRHHTSHTSTWARLASRWTELLEIAAMPKHLPTPQPPLLAQGALRLGEGQAIAWCEMARGLLLHWVQLDAQGRVAGYQVLAPTEWNFHPQGILAQALTSLPAHDAKSALTLAAAFDACVECTVSVTAPMENSHA